MNDQPNSSSGAWRRGAGAYPGYQVALSFIIGWLFILGGGLCGLYLPASIWRTHEFAAHAVHAKVPIVDFKAYPPGRHETHETYRPIVEISGADPGPVRVLVGAAVYPNPLQAGDQIEVVYPPGRPAAAVRANIEDTWGEVIALFIFSPFLLLVGVGIISWMRYFVRYPPEELAWIDRWLVPVKLLNWR